MTGRGVSCPWIESSRHSPILVASETLFCGIFNIMQHMYTQSFHWLCTALRFLLLLVRFHRVKQIAKKHRENRVWKKQMLGKNDIFFFLQIVSYSPFPFMKIFQLKCPGTNSSNRICWTTSPVWTVSCSCCGIYSLISPFMKSTTDRGCCCSVRDFVRWKILNTKG